MAVSYNRLFKMLEQKSISKIQLKQQLGISSTTLAKFKKNEYVSLKVIDEICALLKCQPSDIMEIINPVDTPLLDKLKEEKEMRLKGGIYHQTQIKLAYNSNRIEGSRLSEDQTRYIYETNSIVTENNETASIDDIMETINHFACFDYMLEIANLDLSEEIIKEFHRILKTNTTDSKKDWFNVGNYKGKPNMIGDKETTAPSKVKGEMAKLLADYQELAKIDFEDIVEFHYRFETIHPFQDGNGRVGRMIMFKECLKNNIVPFIIDEQHKLVYHRGLKEFGTKRGYLIETCLSAQDRYQALMDYFNQD